MHRSAALPFLVEEEYLLLPVPPGRRHGFGGGAGQPLGLLPTVDDRQAGGTRCPRQVGAVTPPCLTADEVRQALVRQRRRLAEQAGPSAVLAPVGVVPGGAEHFLTDDSDLASTGRAGATLTRDELVNSMSVHVQLPDRATGITVMNRLRPWLHVLLALSANSPIWHGRDTGFASWRAVLTRTWPASGPPPYLEDAAGYDRQLQRFRSMGVISTNQAVNWTLRLSDRVTGVEIRVADVQLDADSAAMVAELARALVCRALRDTGVGVLEPRPCGEVIQAACWHAARRGVRDCLIDLSPSTAGTPRPAPVADVTAALLAHVEPTSAAGFPALSAWAANVVAGAGSGAQRQRRTWQERGLPGLLVLLGLADAAHAATSVS